MSVETVTPQRGFIPPLIDADSRSWWDALAEGRLDIPRCRSCGRFCFPPVPLCPNCGARDFEMVTASGRGSIYSWIVVHRALDPAFADDVPYVIVVVELAEGVRLLGRLLHGEPAPDAQVEAVIYEVQGQALLGFRPPASDRSGPSADSGSRAESQAT